MPRFVPIPDDEEETNPLVLRWLAAAHVLEKKRKSPGEKPVRQRLLNNLGVLPEITLLRHHYRPSFEGRGSAAEKELYAYAIAGKTKQAIAALDELSRLGRQDYVNPGSIAMIWVGLGDASAWRRSV